MRSTSALAARAANIITSFMSFIADGGYVDRALNSATGAPITVREIQKLTETARGYATGAQGVLDDPNVSTLDPNVIADLQDIVSQQAAHEVEVKPHTDPDTVWSTLAVNAKLDAVGRQPVDAAAVELARARLKHQKVGEGSVPPPATKPPKNTAA